MATVDINGHTVQLGDCRQPLNFVRHELIGARIEIPVHYDMWMRGTRTGEITAFRQGKDGYSDHYLVKMDHPQIKRRLKLWKLDWGYIKILD